MGILDLSKFRAKEKQWKPEVQSNPLPDRPLNRVERRAGMNSIRAYRVRAARARDKECARRSTIMRRRKEKGIGTPAVPISTAIRLAGVAYLDSGKGEALIDRDEASVRQQKIEGSSRRMRQALRAK
jgi:hypothetical protein